MEEEVFENPAAESRADKGSVPDRASAPERASTLERWLTGRPGVGPKHSFGYRLTAQNQGGLMVEVLSRGMGPATSIDRFLGSHNRISTADRRVFEELKTATLGPRQIYMVASQRAGRLLGLLRASNVIDARSQQPIVFRGALKAEISDARDGDRVVLRVRWLTEQGEAIDLSAAPWTVYDDFPPFLWIGRSIFTAPEKLLSETFRRMLQEKEVNFDVGALTQSISRLENVLTEIDVPGEWLAERLEAPVQAAPAFRLVLSFAGQALKAEATVRVGAHEFPLDANVDIPEAVWVPAPPPKWGVRVQRDRVAERDAMQVLTDAGFKCTHDNVWEIAGDDALDLVRRELAPLIGRFETFWVSVPKPNMFRNEALKSHVRVNETQRADWFDVQVSFSTGGASVQIGEVLEQVEAGKRFIQLSDGTFAEATPALRQAIKVMKKLLEAQAESGKAALSAQDVGDLQGLCEVADAVEMSAKITDYLDPLRDFTKIEAVPVPQDFRATLRDYQRDGVSWMAFLQSRSMGGILADDMGLGKTVQTLALLSHMKQTRGRMPSIVVCPTSVVENWVRETHRFVPDFVVHRIDGPHREQFLAAHAETDLFVTSYALLRRDFEKLKPIQFRYAILDEAQAIKNPTSQTALCAKKLTAESRLALTGTPIENRLSELWSIFDFVSPALFGTLTAFKERYLGPIERYNDQDSLMRLRRRVRPFIMRREKEVVAKELPPKTIAQVFCDVPKETQSLYRQIAERAKDHLAMVLKQKGFERSSVSILTELLRLRQVACDPRLLKEQDLIKEAVSPKVDPFLELVDEALESGRKILVFSQFVSMLDILSDALEEKKIAHLMLTGATRRRQELVDKFQADDGPRVFLISLKAGGSGLNLTAADCVIHFDPWWNPAVEEQATDRAHRLGQTKPVFVYELIARGTVEEKILKLKERKRALAEGVLGVDGGLSKLLTEDEVMALFNVDDWGENEDLDRDFDV